jgi:nucleotide-binding universal stress UspA family protein
VLEIRSILAPTDFSRHAEAALVYAFAMAERFGSELHLLHVLPEVVAPIAPEPMLLPTLPPEYYTEAESTARESLAQLVRPEWGKPPRLETVVRWGDTVSAIVSYANERAIDLIVIATHGRSGLGHVLLGSVAERIVREAPCPVLTVRNRETS